MNTQKKLDRLIELGLEIRDVAKKIYWSNCSFQKVTEKVTIYFNDCHETFQVKNEFVELSYWHNPTRLGISTTDLDTTMDTAIGEFIDALDILKGMQPMIDEQKEKHRQWLLDELERLEKE